MMHSPIPKLCTTGHRYDCPYIYIIYIYIDSMQVKPFVHRRSRDFCRPYSTPYYMETCPKPIKSKSDDHHIQTTQRLVLPFWYLNNKVARGEKRCVPQHNPFSTQRSFHHFWSKLESRGVPYRELLVVCSFI